MKPLLLWDWFPAVFKVLLWIQTVVLACLVINGHFWRRFIFSPSFLPGVWWIWSQLLQQCSVPPCFHGNKLWTKSPPDCMSQQVFFWAALFSFFFYFFIPFSTSRWQSWGFLLLSLLQVQMKDFRFSYKFKMACKEDVLKLCPNIKKKYVAPDQTAIWSCNFITYLYSILW